MNDDLVLAIGRQFIDNAMQKEGLVRHIRDLDQKIAALEAERAAAAAAPGGGERAKKDAEARPRAV